MILLLFTILYQISQYSHYNHCRFFSDTESDDDKQSKSKYQEDQKARHLRQSLPPVAANLG